MLKKLFIFGIVAIALSLSIGSCESPSGRKMNSGLQVTGKVGEILVVCDQATWNSEIKNYLDTGLTQFIMPYFPDVATFELVHRTPKHFTQGIKRYRNTLFINIDPKYKGERGKIERREGVWAKNQLVVDITGNSYLQVLETCKNGLDAVHAEFDKVEWERILKRFEKVKNPNVDKALKENFGIKLALPDGAKVVSKKKNFFRIEFPDASRPIDFGMEDGQDKGAVFTGAMVYQYDFVDSSQLELANLLTARDTVLKYNVPHEVEGMYMGTQYSEIVYPESIEMKSYDESVSGVDMRGMFQFKGMDKFGTGGAFWSFHFVHPTTNKLICVSGYVDAPPTTSWTHFLRESQAILKSVELAQ